MTPIAHTLAAAAKHPRRTATDGGRNRASGASTQPAHFDWTDTVHAFRSTDSNDPGNAQFRITAPPGGAAFIVDADLRYRMAEGDALTAAGFEPRDFVGRTIFEVLDAAQLVEYEPRYRRALAGRGFSYEHEAHGRHYVTSGVPFRNGSERIEGVLAFSHDITESKEKERDLQAAVTGKNELLAVLAHELRNPVAPMTYALEMIQLSGVPSAATQALDVLHRQLGQMKRLIQDVADASQASGGMLELKRRPVELCSLVRDAVEATRQSAKVAGISLALELPAAPIRMDGDPVRLAQVFSNLLTNALKYTDTDGRVEVRVSSEPGGALVSVQDTGIGVSQEMLERVFDMFVQVESSVQRSQQGLGIGLALVRRIVEMHGGSVALHSDGAGKGTRVQVRLPTSAST